jgi:protein involved in polysaccharide export with SLBB domain
LLDASIPVYGKVRNPGIYPVSNNITAQQALKIAGGSIVDNSSSTNKVLFGSRKPEDQSDLIYVSLISNFSIFSDGYVELNGEFKFPGKYKINRGDRLLDIINRAGGFTEFAFPLGGILTRNEIKEKESKALLQAENELSDILASAVVSGVVTQSSGDLMSLISLMSSIKNSQPTGRLIAELDPILIKKDPSLNLEVKPGDIIFMPSVSNTVTIVGSVLNPVTVPYQPNLSFEDYVNLAGGYKEYADAAKSYIILPNGKSAKPSKIGIFSKNDDILPGSTIIVPRDARPLSGLSLVEVVTPILANLSITAASIASISSN